MSIHDDAKIDCHTHLFDPARFPYRADTPYAPAGLDQAGFQALLSLARRDGRVAVKLSGLQKFASIDHLQEQAGPYVQALLTAFGARACVWGSDWPFRRERSRVDYGPLLALAERLMPQAEVRHQVLWQTPQRLFGF